MSQDIEAFLRMAQQRRQMLQQGQQGQQPANMPPLMDVEVVEEEEEVRTLAPSIKTQIDTSGIAEHVSHLGERVQSASSQTEQRISGKFEHNVGRLVHQEGVASPDTKKHVVEQNFFAKLFSSPDDIKRAVIMKEILERPDFDDM